MFIITNNLKNYHASGSGNSPPVFTQDMNNFVLSENTPVGTIVFKLEGYDPEGGNVTFGMIGSDNFEVNPNGEVKLIKPLDREVSKVFFRLTNKC